jgi:hypothetical protein
MAAVREGPDADTAGAMVAAVNTITSAAMPPPLLIPMPGRFDGSVAGPCPG